jgi:hypothetical protein
MSDKFDKLARGMAKDSMTVEHLRQARQQQVAEVGKAHTGAHIQQALAEQRAQASAPVPVVQLPVNTVPGNPKRK